MQEVQETWIRSLGQEDLLEEEMATHFSILGLPLWLGSQRISLQCRRPGFDPWIGKIPWRRERLPTPLFWPGEFHGLYSPRGRKKSDMAEQLSLTLYSILAWKVSLDIGAWQAAWVCEELDTAE